MRRLTCGFPLALLLLVACTERPPPSTAAPRLRVDGDAYAVSVDASATRQSAHLAVTSSSPPTLFGQPLTGFQIDLDLSTVPDDGPPDYAISLVAGCSRDEQVQVALGPTSLVEDNGAAQPTWLQLAVDGCLMSPGAIELTGQTNVEALDQVHVDMIVFFNLARGDEQHVLALDDLSIDFP